MSEQVERNIVRIPITSIRADEKNPRKTFQEVEPLADSIHKTDDIQVPIIVEDLGSIVEVRGKELRGDDKQVLSDTD